MEEPPCVSVRLLKLCSYGFLMIRVKAVSDQAILHGPEWQYSVRLRSRRVGSRRLVLPW